MKPALKYTTVMLGVVFCSYLVALVWWILWMRGFVFGPIPFLHGIIWADGESSYDLTETEMFFHVLVVLGGFVLFRFWRKKVPRET